MYIDRQRPFEKPLGLLAQLAPNNTFPPVGNHMDINHVLGSCITGRNVDMKTCLLKSPITGRATGLIPQKPVTPKGEMCTGFFNF